MAIVLSEIIEVAAQKDGRRWVRERHTDHVARVFERSWLAELNDNLNAALAAYATQLGLDLPVAEIGANMAAVLRDGSLASPTLVYSTMPQNRTALRVAYQAATGVEAINIGDYLSTLTDAQLQSAFGLTAGQVTTLRANKLSPAATAAATIRAATGA